MLSLADKPQNGQAKPVAGESTSRQQMGVGIGGLFGGVPGFDDARFPAGPRTWRMMSRNPTLALAKAVLTGPIFASAWTFEAGPSATDERVKFIQDQFEGRRSLLLTDALRFLEFGKAAFEKVWKLAAGKLSIDKLKPLLPDMTEILLTEAGAFAGIKNGKAELAPNKCFVATWGGEAGNFNGEPLHENCRREWSQWLQTGERAGQLATKVASIIPMVHYPEGDEVVTGGQRISAFAWSQTVLNSLSLAKGISVPNMLNLSDDAKTQAELAGKGRWVISFLEATSAAASMSGMTDRQRYYDSLMVRGWLLPERAVVEAQTAGSRADSETGADTIVLTAERIQGELDRQLNWYAIDDILAQNFGEQARGSVYIKSAPLVDEQRAIFTKIIDAVLANPGTLEETLVQADVDAIFDAMKIPKAGGKIVDFAGTRTNSDEPLTPEQAAKVGEDATVTNPAIDPTGTVPPDMQLNGAQINAAVDLINQVRSGTLVASVAIDLLVAVGIPRDRAEAMVKATAAAPALPKPEDAEST